MITAYCGQSVYMVMGVSYSRFGLISDLYFDLLSIVSVMIKQVKTMVFRFLSYCR